MSLIQRKGRTLQRDNENYRNDPEALVIKEQVNNWIRQVEELYSFIESVLAGHEVEFKKNTNISMYEKPMEEHGLSAEEDPILDLYRSGKLIATFKPLGLWVTGGRGRIDILTETSGFLLTDVSESRNAPEWKVFSPEKSENFDDKFITNLINSQ